MGAGLETLGSNGKDKAAGKADGVGEGVWWLGGIWDVKGTADGVVATEILGCKAVDAGLDEDDELGSPM